MLMASLKMSGPQPFKIPSIYSIKHRSICLLYMSAILIKGERVSDFCKDSMAVAYIPPKHFQHLYL